MSLFSDCFIAANDEWERVAGEPFTIKSREFTANTVEELTVEKRAMLGGIFINAATRIRISAATRAILPEPPFTFVKVTECDDVDNCVYQVEVKSVCHIGETTSPQHSAQVAQLHEVLRGLTRVRILRAAEARHQRQRVCPEEVERRD